MNPLLIYTIKASFCLASFYLFYILFLDRDTLYSRNRIFLLLSLAASHLLPFIVIPLKQAGEIQFAGIDLSGIMLNTRAEPSETGSTIHSSINTGSVLNAIYLTGVIILSLTLVFEMLKLLFLIIRKKEKDDRIIRLAGNRITGFTAFGYIFIDESADSGEEEIIRHEQKHLESGHFYDILLMELIRIFQWFNPFVYLYNRSLRAVHEFEADEKCLSAGASPASYQGLILDQVFRTKVFSSANRFSHPTLIKKRMIMMTKKRSGKLASLKILMVVPVVIFLILIISTCSKQSFDSFSGSVTATGPQQAEQAAALSAVRAPVIEGDAYVVVEQMPMFPGGDIALLRYIAENTSYPEEAKVRNIEGRVIIRFMVLEDGTVSALSVIRGVDPVLDNEALRVVSTVPKFEPGKQNGVAVPVWYMVPITFALPDKSGSDRQAPPALQPSQAGAVMEVSVPGSEEPFVVVEEMPLFPGGDAAILQYLADNLRYPAAARENKITGRVIVRFCVNATGQVDRVSVLKGVNPELDAEAVRLVSTLPAFRPGRQNGRAVPVWYMAPVNFGTEETKTGSPE